MFNIVELIREETSDFHGKTAVAGRHSEISYKELFSSVEGLSSVLRENGVRPTDRVALLCADGMDYISAALGAVAAGATVVPVSPFLADPEMENLLKRMETVFLVADRSPGSPDIRKELLSTLDGIENKLSLYKLSAEDTFPAEYRKMNPAFIRFSSGTTGNSKGVLLSHEKILERISCANKALRVTPDDTIFWVLSMSFHFVVSIILFLRNAATILLCDKAFPESLLQLSHTHPATLMYASPLHYRTLASSKDIPRSAVSGMRLAVSTATSLSENVASAFAARFGLRLSSAYGIIEAGLPFIDICPDLSHAGSVGRILPDYSAFIKDPDSTGTGQIMIRGPGMFDAYCSPWKNASETLCDGWFDTGDMGKMDDNGYLYISGRRNDVINFAGMKVFPYEIEAVVNSHPAVKESLAYGISRPNYGQLPAVKIVLENSSATDDIKHELRRYCYRRLAAYKTPKQFTFCKSLQRTASNKLTRTTQHKQ